MELTDQLISYSTALATVYAEHLADKKFGDLGTNTVNDKRKLLRFLQIFDESQKLSLLIDFAVKEKSYK